MSIMIWWFGLVVMVVLLKKGWVPVDVFSTGWRQEGHPASKSLRQLPLMECTLPQLLFLHHHPFCSFSFFQVGLLDRALISLGLALSPPSTSVSSDFMVLCKCSLKIILTSLYLVEGLAWWDWPFTWCTDQLLSFSAWPVKIVPDMTYNVFGGTLNPTLLLLLTILFFNP